MEYILLIWILASFIGSIIRTTQREPSFKTFGLFWLEFFLYPAIKAYEDLDMNKHNLPGSK